MSIKLENYSKDLTDLSPEVKKLFESTFYETAQAMSPAGLKNFLDGAKTLTDLKRGNDIVITYLQEIPRVIKECDEYVIADVIATTTKLTSLSSAKVASTMLSNLPAVSYLLGDTELVRDYLNLLQKLANKTTRGLQPMLNHIEELLSKLTLEGLESWASFGVQAYRRDYSNLTKYFNLESQDSIAILEKFRRGVLFIDTQRKLNLYLRALWGRDFTLKPSNSANDNFRPYIEDNIIHLPDAIDAEDDITSHKIFRAAAAHMAAHYCYSGSSIAIEQTDPIPKFFIGFIEDARIEYKATRRYPGLQKLWGSLLNAESIGNSEHPTLKELKDLACMLLNGKTNSESEYLNNFAKQFHQEIETEQDNNQFSKRKGLELFDYFMSKKPTPSIQDLERMFICYRDDNRFIWSQREHNSDGSSNNIPSIVNNQKNQIAPIIKLTGEVDREQPKSNAGKGASSAESFPTENQEDINIRPALKAFHYQEWDYQINLYRPDWVTVYEQQQSIGNPEDVEKILFEHQAKALRIKQMIDLLSPKGVRRIRNMEDGDEIDLNAAIESMISIRMGEQANTHITKSNVLKIRDLSVLVLLDLSESTNDKAQGSEKTVLELTREASILVASAIDGIGDPFAIHGFASDGRHDVQYYHFKDFNQKYDDNAKSRLAGMQGNLSTRMGAALRHASHHLLKQPERRKLLLIVTDGEPADIDEHDPQHLRHDTKKAIGELKSQGINSYCLTLDPTADNYVKWIFGTTNYTILDKIDKLPEKLPALFASLTA